KALDDIALHKPFDRQLIGELDKVASRKYFSGFLTRGREETLPEDERDFQNYDGNTRYQSHYYAGCIKRQDADGVAWFELKTRVEEGDALEVFFPGQFDSRWFTAGQLKRGDTMHSVLSGGIGEVGMYIPFAVPEHAFLARQIKH
ncbi:MAG TPA: peptidase U32, partial [Turneriella sp.]|nr:peptidase U32 [Turneriella sp.]